MSDGVVRVTSYPYGTNRKPDPYGERTLLQVLDVKTGRQVGSDLLGNNFTFAGRVVIEQSYARSVGEACAADLVARRLDGEELWRRSFEWQRSKPDRERDWDCALGLDANHLAGDRVDLNVRTRFGVVLDTATGRTLWDHGGNRLVIDSDPESGTDVVTGYRFYRYLGISSDTHAERWRATGEPTYDEAPDGYLALAVDEADGSKGFELRAVSDGEVSLRARGTFLASGPDWVAATVESEEGVGHRVELVHWPH